MIRIDRFQSHRQLERQLNAVAIDPSALKASEAVPDRHRDSLAVDGDARSPGRRPSRNAQPERKERWPRGMEAHCDPAFDRITPALGESKLCAVRVRPTKRRWQVQIHKYTGGIAEV